ncbi:DUF6179 domain-containing protein, partial [Ruminococcaceae bacterium OttesenSCG-928-O06]|nr:DUF6179 domain-containing protein [Ruminococcaceae bacterium OttesenSCG-928-O06]
MERHELPVPAQGTQGVAPAPPGGPLPRFSPEEVRCVMQRQVALYTGMESTSVPVETAAELMESVLFCVRAATQEAQDPAPQGLAQHLLAGQRVLYRRQAAHRRLLKMAEARCLPLENVVYQEALAELHTFFTWYDIRFFAHQIPCMLDYPLAIPVPDEYQGTDYIGHWLHRRLWEDALCAHFPIAQVQAVLHRHHPAWAQLPLNLFEPVFACALGKALLGKPPSCTLPLPEEQTALWELFSGCDAARLDVLLKKAAGHLAGALRAWGTAQRAYYT